MDVDGSNICNIVRSPLQPRHHFTTSHRGQVSEAPSHCMSFVALWNHGGRLLDPLNLVSLKACLKSHYCVNRMWTMSKPVASFRWPLAPLDHSYVSLCMLSRLTLASKTLPSLGGRHHLSCTLSSGYRVGFEILHVETWVAEMLYSGPFQLSHAN